MLGDLVAQAPEISKGKKWDAKRTAKMGAFGLALHGPIGHYWYGFLDRTIMTAAPTSAAAVATKTAVDQIFFAPIFTSMFFGSMKVMDGKADEVKAEVAEKLWPTMKVNWTVYVLSLIIQLLSILAIRLLPFLLGLSSRHVLHANMQNNDILTLSLHLTSTF